MKQYIHKLNGKIETKEINKSKCVFQPILIEQSGVTVTTWENPGVEKRDFSKFEI